MKNVFVDSYIQQANHVVSKRIDGNGILLKLEDGYYFEVNPVGLEIWERCDGQRSMETILAQVAKKFKVSRDHLKKDSADFLEELRKRKLIKTSPAAFSQSGSAKKKK